MNIVNNDAIIEKLRSAMGDKVEIIPDALFTYIKVSPDDLLTLMQLLRDQLGMNYLANLTVVDLGENFELVYHLYAIPDNQQKLVVKTRVPINQAELPSVSAIYPTADWQEREVWDLMGVIFSQHPNLVRVLLPDNFSGHPLRKDFKKEA